MSKERELLRRIQRYIGNQYLTAETLELSNDIDDFLTAAPEAEYDLSSVIPLTHRKAKGIINDNGYHVTGFVLTREDDEKCIVDMSAVRWLTGKEFFEMMHPPVVSPTSAPEMYAELEAAMNVFRFYQGHHAAKGHSDKEQTNKQYADRIEKVLAKARGEG